jgi:hypothetical protein
VFQFLFPGFFGEKHFWLLQLVPENSFLHLTMYLLQSEILVVIFQVIEDPDYLI